MTEEVKSNDGTRDRVKNSTKPGKLEEEAFFCENQQKFLKHVTYLNIPIMAMQASLGKRKTQGQRSIWQVSRTVLGTKILEQKM